MRVNDELNERRNAELRRDFALQACETPVTASVIAGTGVEVRPALERREGPAGDRDSVFKAALAKAHGDPRGLAKASDAPDDGSVVGLIRKAHGAPQAIEDLERGYRGRDQALVAKATVGEAIAEKFDTPSA